MTNDYTFPPSWFTSSALASAQNKAAVTTALMRWIEKDCPAETFTARMWRSLLFMFPFMGADSAGAAKSREAAFKKWFSGPQQRARWARMVAKTETAGDASFSLCDMADAIKFFLADTDQGARFEQAAADAVGEAGRAALRALAAKYPDELEKIVRGT